MTSLSHISAAEISADALARMRNAREQIAIWKQVEADARAVIERELGEHDTGLVDGQPVVRWAHVKSNRLDQTLLKAMHPNAYAECQTTSTSRRFTLLDGE